MTFIQWARTYVPQNVFPLAIEVSNRGGGLTDAYTRTFVDNRLIKGWDEWKAFFLSDWSSW